MPWSDWIESEPYERGTFARYRMATQTGATDYSGSTLDEVVGTAEGALYSPSSTEAVTTVYGQLAGANPGASRSEAYDDIGHPGTWVGGIVQAQAVTWFDTDDLELATWREWFPPELGDLTEGVDYEVRPDRTGTEDDAFIEYESDAPGEIDHWFAFAFGVINVHTGSYEPPRHATVKWRLLTPAPSVPAIPPVGGSVDAPPLVLTPDAGSPITEMLNATGVGSGSGVPVNVNVDGSVSEFAVLMVTDESSDIPFNSGTPGDDAYGHGWSASGIPTTAAAYVRLPRWRYWIPGEQYVKLLHRGDGLGLSTRRLRGGGDTAQSGRLRGSY